MAGASRQKAFDREFRPYLDRHTAALVAALRNVITSPVPPVVKVLVFETQADWEEFPVNVFAMDDASPKEVYYESPFNDTLLPGVGPLVPDGAIDQDGYEEDGVATFESGARLMAVWFGECWHTADGGKFSIPAYIHLHDDSDYFDLGARRWVKDTAIWR